jgi:hypothetical protein
LALKLAGKVQEGHTRLYLCLVVQLPAWPKRGNPECGETASQTAFQKITADSMSLRTQAPPEMWAVFYTASSPVAEENTCTDTFAIARPARNVLHFLVSPV